ncbi:hypothetical protein AK812_SmicGene14697 [Symbiodinium microadriaticum]|uniref:OTU domain-containing protein n=1 Tax=Symbiodinium microadriaticum TaxID=2951 RepID=A0A1Q9E4Y6_SYMMI|nr:hypothetical protein AK812_SmicGene14697 [Symbiodinium microadriaticum]
MPAKDKGKGKGKGKQKGTQSPDRDVGGKGSRSDDRHRSQISLDSQLLEALKTMVGRAEANPAGILGRLRGLVEQAAKGHLQGPKRKNKARKDKNKRAVPRQSPGDASTPVAPSRASSLSSLVPSMWGSGEISSVSQCKAALENGTRPNGKVVFVQHEHVAAELLDLGRLHNIKGEFMVMVPFGMEVPGHEASEQSFQYVVEDGKQRLLKVDVYLIGQRPDYVDRRVVKSTAQVNVTPLDLVTFWAQIPQSCVQPAVWKVILNGPVAHLKQWCAMCGQGCFHSTFAWKRNTYKTKEGKDEVILEGFLKVPTAKATEVLNHSGRAGLFLERTRQEQPRRDPVEWIPPLAEETSAGYYARVWAGRNGNGVAFRRGGGSWLGVRQKTFTPKRRLWKVTKVPQLWGETELIEALEGIGATEVEAHSGPKRRGGFWLMYFQYPQDDGTGIHGFECGGQTMWFSYMTGRNVTVKDQRKVSPGAWTSLRPTVPRAETDSKEEAGETLEAREGPELLSSGEQHQMDVDSTKKEPGKRPAASPAKPPSKVARAVKMPTKEQDFDLIDCGAAGQCGFNVIALGKACAGKGRKEVDEKRTQAALMGTTLRATLSAYLRRHPDLVQYFVKDAGTADQNDGPAPSTWDEFCQAVLRPKFWIDALCIMALARRLQARVVVLVWSEGSWSNKHFFGKPGDPLVVMAFKDHHYQLVVPKQGKEFPPEWSSNSEHWGIEELSGQGRGGTRSTVSASSWLPPSTRVSSVSRRSSSKPPSSRLKFSARPSSWIPPSSSSGSRKQVEANAVSSPPSPSAAVTQDSEGDRDQHASARHLGEPVELAKGSKMLWWPCPLCPFRLYRVAGDEVHNNGLCKRKKLHCEVIHGVPAPPAARGSVGAVMQQLQARAANLKSSYRSAIKWMRGQKWAFAHRMAGKVRWDKCGAYETWVDHCVQCAKVFRLAHVAGGYCLRHPDLKHIPTDSASSVRTETRLGPREVLNTEVNWRGKAKASKEGARLAGSASCRRLGRILFRSMRSPMWVRCVGNLRGGSREGLVWSGNLSSWRLHAKWFLDEAVAHHVDVACLQETQLSHIMLPGAASLAARSGYHLWAIPAPATRRGGVAILVRQDLPTRVMRETSASTGQLLVAEVELNGCPVQVASVYSSVNETAVSDSVLDWARTLRDRPAIVAGDFNKLARDEDFLGNLTDLDFAVQARGGHRTSPSPIDFIFVKNIHGAGGGVCAEHQLEDHDLLWLSVARVPSRPRMLRMLEHPKLRPPQTSTDMPAVDAPFDDDGWRQLLDEGDVEAAWLLLSRAAEDQLRRCGRVVGSERHPRGSLPKVVPSTSRIGAGQSHRERQLRRSVRLAQEVRRASSSPIPADLARKLGTALRREGGDPKLVQQRRWREIEQYFHGLLNALLQAENRQALSEWRQRVQNPSQAIAWVKNDVRPPLVVDVEEGTRAGPSAVAEAMRSWWSSLWSTTAAQDLDHLRERLDNMCRAAGRNVSPDQLQPLQAADLQAVLRSMLPKATGLDGWEAQALLALTPLMFDRFVFFLQEVERLQQWPDALCAWRVVYIPKKISRNPGSYRPIAVGAILYRAWAKLRASQVARKFSSSFAPTQGGGRGVPDAPVLVMDILQRQHEGWVYGAAFDLEKAFDSMHSDLAVDVMLRHGLHPSVAGDPFSPWALSLWMGLLVQEALRNLFPRAFVDKPVVLGHMVGSAESDNPEEDKAFRWTVARSLMVPKLAWHYGTGRVPSTKASSEYKALLKAALQGRAQGSRHSWELRLAFQLGYQGDLLTCAALTFFRVFTKWLRMPGLLPASSPSTFESAISSPRASVFERAAARLGFQALQPPRRRDPQSRTWVWICMGAQVSLPGLVGIITTGWGGRGLLIYRLLAANRVEKKFHPEDISERRVKKKFHPEVFFCSIRSLAAASAGFNG